MDGLLDNPIFVKHVRTRLRRSGLLAPALVVAALTLLMVWADVVSGGFPRMAPALNAMMQTILLVFIGASQVGTSVGSARESGILDFHRISPVPPASLAGGFFLGAPVREYLLFAMTLPLSLAGAALAPTGPLAPNVPGLVSAHPWADMIQGIVGVVLAAWLVHAVSMLAALATRKPTKAAGLPVLVVLGLFAFNGLQGLFWMMGGPNRQAGMLSFFGVHFPWVVVTAIYALPLTAFALVASTRKMRSERAPLLSKLEAIAFVVLVGALALGGGWSMPGSFLPVLYATTALALVAAVTITPTSGDYGKGVRRAVRAGGSHLPPWDDLALNRPALVVIALVGLAVGLLGRQFLPAPGFSLLDEAGTLWAVVVAALSVLGFGLVHQYFRLRVPTSAGTMTGLFVFLAWIVPMLAGIIAKTASLPEDLATTLLALSPISGLAVLAFGGSSGMSMLSLVAALVPAVGVPLVVFGLITAERARFDRSARATAAGRAGASADKPAPPAALADDPPPAALAPGLLEVDET